VLAAGAARRNGAGIGLPDAAAVELAGPTDVRQEGVGADHDHIDAIERGDFLGPVNWTITMVAAFMAA
jgi:hypothetical protein